jgi:hypothetical protein
MLRVSYLSHADAAVQEQFVGQARTAAGKAGFTFLHWLSGLEAAAPSDFPRG